MSREEAHRRDTARRPAATGPPGAGRPPEEEARPQPPVSTGRIDRTTGTVSISGHLDLVGAEALCRVVTALGQLGHRQVVVQLGCATITDDARALLAHLAGRLPAGDRLVLR